VTAREQWALRQRPPLSDPTSGSACWSLTDCPFPPRAAECCAYRFASQQEPPRLGRGLSRLSKAKKRDRNAGALLLRRYTSPRRRLLLPARPSRNQPSGRAARRAALQKSRSGRTTLLVLLKRRRDPCDRMDASSHGGAVVRAFAEEPTPGRPSKHGLVLNTVAELHQREPRPGEEAGGSFIALGSPLADSADGRFRHLADTEPESTA
jgi:hypothetical protein